MTGTHDQLARAIAEYGMKHPDELRTIAEGAQSYESWEAARTMAVDIAAMINLTPQPIADERIADMDAIAGLVSRATPLVAAISDAATREAFGHSLDTIASLAGRLRAALVRVGELERDMNYVMADGLELAERFAAAEARLTAATATIAELTADRDEWLTQYGRAKDGLARQLARAEAAEARERGLRELLRETTEALAQSYVEKSAADNDPRIIAARSALTTEPTT